MTNCGTCHTLAAAGTDGVVGPNLDQLLALPGGHEQSAIDGDPPRVLSAISSGVGTARMPKGILEGRGGPGRELRRPRRRPVGDPRQTRPDPPVRPARWRLAI